MPNFCDNFMEITGPNDEIARFKRTCVGLAAEEAYLDFGAIVPMPGIFYDDPGQILFPDPDAPEFREQVETQKAFEARALEATGSAHARDWVCEHWGTDRWPWDFEVIRDEPNSYECKFVTAWTPPVGIWRELGEMFPTLDFSLSGYDFLEGWGFRGTIRDGKLELLEVPLIWVNPKTGKTASGTMEEADAVLGKDLSFALAPAPAWDERR